MLDAIDEAHIKRLNEENERGGEAREVVASVARTLDVVLGDTGIGQSMWDPANMRRVVCAAEALRNDLAKANESVDEVCEKYLTLVEERDELRAKHDTTCDLLRHEYERANAAIEREETADEAAAEIGQYARQLERERDNYKRAYEAKPARMVVNHPPIQAQNRPDAALWPLLTGTRKVVDDVDDLKATIVSQAREIARLKGESA
ncbi:hypothetical protein [Streptomyces fulvorobeus]|nr:hypothetical protein [Streptomyces fulvorobeus]NYE44216.1 chromosome segregation ATPase [Streptomyces fulvorobeus]